MAPTKEAASAAEAEATRHLLDLSHDEQSIVTQELCDPLRPLLAVHLSSPANGLWLVMREQLVELRQQHAEAAAMARAWGMSCAALADETQLWLCGWPDEYALTLTHWSTLGMLVGCGSLPWLARLYIDGDDNGDEGVAALADGLRRGRLPSLHVLHLDDAQIGPHGAAALAPALTERALPSLAFLSLAGNPLGDAGLAALLPALRRLPPLKGLSLLGTNIGDEGVASLVAQPTAGALKTLESLYLERNEISDAGCASLASALRGGALPALKRLNLDENPPSKEARDAVFAARPGVESRYHSWFLG
jgi:Leucine-rich repeat (LRR) protein